MKLKSLISLANPFKAHYIKEKLNLFGKYLEFSFDFQDCNSIEQTASFLHDKIIDCAVIDAKNCLDFKLDFLDWFFVNLYENIDFDLLISNQANKEKIGVVTNSQWLYCKKRFNNATISFIKEFKSIDQLLADYSTVMLPGYVAYDSKYEFYTEKINIADIQKSSFEGFACVEFRKNDERFTLLRQFFIKSVYFIGAGVGSLKYATQEAIHTIKNVEVCLFDNLMDHALLDFLPDDAILVDVGKRCEHHKLNQSKITDLISTYARMGFRVGRLKGGDPSIFGRLAEEIKVLEDLKINFNIVPGISTINALSIKSGIILTRREVNRGFCVLSAIKHKGAAAEFSKSELSGLPLVFFMGVKVVGKISSSLISEGYLPQTKVAVVFSIGSDKEFTVRGTLSDIASKVNSIMDHLFFDNPPGIFIIGEISNFYYKRAGLLQDKRILLPMPLDDKLYFGFKDTLANPLTYDLDIKYNINSEILGKIIAYDAIAVSYVKIAQALIEAFFEQKKDIRMLPKIITQSDDVLNLFSQYGLRSVIDIETISNLNVCILYNHVCCDDFVKALLKKNQVSEIKLKSHIYKQNKLQTFDMIYFNDLDQYYDFVYTYGANCLKDKIILLKNISDLKEISPQIKNPFCMFDKTNFKSSVANLIKNL
ncbi:uroporphyrinogen-III C-methyltransferase [Desulfurella sp.]|uniref:uroporphyrinogen-III C-methyltransferase n=1 Tax=Desulfurella sp. TaxID=1962857 RepID=UPI003D10FD7F